MKLNMNNMCQVKLNAKSWLRLMDVDPIAYKYNYDGETHILRVPLWKIMNIFGPMCEMGMSVAFDKNEIEIDET